VKFKKENELQSFREEQLLLLQIDRHLQRMFLLCAECKVSYIISTN